LSYVGIQKEHLKYSKIVVKKMSCLRNKYSLKDEFVSKKKPFLCKNLGSSSKKPVFQVRKTDLEVVFGIL
jgi:hypothetical protein